MRTYRYIGLFIFIAAYCLTARAQITSLESLDNGKGYLLARLPETSAGNGRVVATEGLAVEVSGQDNDTDFGKWAVYTSAATGERYIYNLGTGSFLVNTSDGCTLSESASPFYIIESSAPGEWLLMNNFMLTGLAEENNGALFSKDEEFNPDGITFSITETARALTEEETGRIERLVGLAEDEARTAVIEEAEELLAEAKRLEQAGKDDFAGNYDYAELEDAVNNETLYPIEEIEALIERTKASVYPAEGRYYRILNKARPTNGAMDNVLSITDYIGSMNLAASNLGNQIPGARQEHILENTGLFQFFKTGDGDNSFILYNPGAKVYAGESDSGASIPLTQYESGAASYNLVYESDHLFRFQNSRDNTLYITANGESNCVSYNQLEEAEKWYFREITEIEISMDGNGYATLCLPCPVELPAEIEAYIAVSLYDSYVRVEKLEDYISGNILPAYTPVILKLRDGIEASSFPCPIVYDAPPAEDLHNLLQGVTVSGELEENSYILKDGESGMGFYRINPNETEINCNRVYLPESPSHQSNLFLLDFYGETSSVSPEREADGGEKDKIYYDLNGRRVMNPQKGIFITQEGEKVIMK